MSINSNSDISFEKINGQPPKDKVNQTLSVIVGLIQVQTLHALSQAEYAHIRVSALEFSREIARDLFEEGRNLQSTIIAHVLQDIALNFINANEAANTLAQKNEELRGKVDTLTQLNNELNKTDKILRERLNEAYTEKQLAQEVPWDRSH